MQAARKIMIVVPSLNRGGAETHLLRVLPELVREGVFVELHSLRDGELRSAFVDAGVLINKPVRFWPLNYLAYIAKLLFRRPDTVHFFLPMAYVLCAPIAWMLGIRCIMSRRSLNVYQNHHPIAARVERWLHKRMYRVLGNSQKVVKQLIEDEGAPRDRVGLIYNGITIPERLTEAEQACVRSELGLAADVVVMTIVANLIPYKGHVDLLNACDQIQDCTDRPWHLLVVGHDSAGIQTELQTQANQLGIEKHVTFLGQRTDVHLLLAASDIGLLCSHEEGFSNAILEGMAAGLPMIVTDVGGNAEAVINEETGLVVPSQDPNALASAMVELINDTSMRKEMGGVGRQRCVAAFSLEACVAAYRGLFLEADK